jgi:hypothetical protein
LKKSGIVSLTRSNPFAFSYAIGGEDAVACVSAIDSNGQTIWIADAHRDDGKRFVVHADQKLTAFMELESAIRASRR